MIMVAEDTVDAVPSCGGVEGRGKIVKGILSLMVKITGKHEKVWILVHGCLYGMRHELRADPVAEMDVAQLSDSIPFERRGQIVDLDGKPHNF